MSAKVEPLLTVADLDLLPDDGNRYELFDGELYVSRAPGLSHQRVLANLILLLGNYLRQNPVGEMFPTPGVIFDEYNAVIPDVVFLTAEHLKRIGAQERIEAEAPALAIEIVSPGKENARRDRLMKRQAYGKYGVEEYWIADPEARTLEIYRQAEGALALVATRAGDDEVTTPLLPDFKCTARQTLGK
ncbi:MAG TPA: Uma2 family endonuclease [Pyrinomonadaceae bacterium]|jgi:Uma2 family endonuclease